MVDYLAANVEVWYLSTNLLFFLLMNWLLSPCRFGVVACIDEETGDIANKAWFLVAAVLTMVLEAADAMNLDVLLPDLDLSLVIV